MSQLDSGLHLVDSLLTSLWSEKEGAVRSGVKMIHSTFNNSLSQHMKQTFNCFYNVALF